MHNINNLQPVDIDIPIRIIHGIRDHDVPHEFRYGQGRKNCFYFLMRYRVHQIVMSQQSQNNIVLAVCFLIPMT